jgi:NADH dehydrogenase/NADH:ubiquinone oxidoreductase subunit G
MPARVAVHPILGDLPPAREVTIYVDGEPISAREGEPIAVALLAAGRRVLRWTEKLGEPRGLFCALGRCTDCAMTVDGRPNVRTCVTPVREGMVVETQDGRSQETGVRRQQNGNGEGR